MEILKGKYRIVGLKPENDGRIPMQVRLNGHLAKVDMAKLTEQQAAALVKDGCRWVEKVEKPKRSAGKDTESS